MTYNLYWERPEILGSGSDTQYIGSVKTESEALEAYNSHKCNRIERLERIDGKLVIKVYDYTVKDFV